MKLATFQVRTDVGPFDRFGVVVDHAGKRLVVDANFAHAAQAAERGRATPYERADAFCPAELTAYAAVHGTDHALLQETVDWAVAKAGSDPANLRGVRGERIVWALGDVRLRPPITKIPVLRDFAAFKDHLDNTFGRMGLKIPDVWYERPMAFKANSTSLYGQEDDVPWPRYTEKMDYELEVAAVIGVPGRNIPLADAPKHILGYTLLNDFSARDTQRGEMQNSTGPFKGKDFAWGLGPWIVTPDELGDVASLKMSVRINGELWVESSPGEMHWTFPECIAYTSQDETLNIGDVLGSGTVNRGCGFEIDRWIKAGDTVEIIADRIGVLRNRVVRDSAAPIRWKRG